MATMTAPSSDESGDPYSAALVPHYGPNNNYSNYNLPQLQRQQYQHDRQRTHNRPTAQTGIAPPFQPATATVEKTGGIPDDIIASQERAFSEISRRRMMVSSTIQPEQQHLQHGSAGVSTSKKEKVGGIPDDIIASQETGGIPDDIISSQERAFAEISKRHMMVVSSTIEPERQLQVSAGVSPQESYEIVSSQERALAEIKMRQHHQQQLSIVPRHESSLALVVPPPREVTYRNSTKPMTDAIHPDKYTMKKQRKLNTAGAAVGGAVVGGVLLGTVIGGPAGAVVGGVAGGVAANKMSKAGEKRAQRKWEQANYQHDADHSKLAQSETAYV